MTNIEDKDLRTNGRWTKVQHQKFLLGLELYGKNWKKIQQLVGTRTGSQIRSHAQKFFLKVKKTADGAEGSEEGQESHQHFSPMTVISKPFQEYKSFYPELSYFMSKILVSIKAAAGQHEFNFWEEFIDSGFSKSETQSVEEIRRKDSFVTFDNCSDSKETMLYNVPILGEPVL